MINMIQREQYIERIRPFIGKDLIKVIVGIRRCGKSTLLRLLQEELMAKGVSEEDILSINYESKCYDEYKTADSLYKYVQAWHKNRNSKVYLFFDEIQEVYDWEKAVNSFRVDFNCDIYVTGSNSKMLSTELATYLRGRYVSFTLYPFTFKEMVAYYGQEDKGFSIGELFADYVRYGGFPQRFVLQDELAVQSYLSDLYDTIVLKDIVERNHMKTPELLRKVLEFLINNIGNPFSANTIANKLRAEGVKTTVDTVLSYVGAVCNAFALCQVKRYNISGKQLLESQEKYYSIDMGFHTILSKTAKQDIGHIYENIVYLELLSRGWNVMVGKLSSGEVDFVCTRGDKTIYVQVAYLITESDMEREFGNLEKIQNNYPKYVISSDPIDLSRNGIIHKNIIRFLLEI